MHRGGRATGLRWGRGLKGWARGVPSGVPGVILSYPSARTRFRSWTTLNTCRNFLNNTSSAHRAPLRPTTGGTWGSSLSDPGEGSELSSRARVLTSEWLSCQKHFEQNELQNVSHNIRNNTSSAPLVPVWCPQMGEPQGSVAAAYPGKLPKGFRGDFRSPLRGHVL